MRILLLAVAAALSLAGCADRASESTDAPPGTPAAGCDDANASERANETGMETEDDLACEAEPPEPPASSAMCVEGAEDCDDMVAPTTGGQGIYGI